VHQPIAELGARAVDRLLERIEEGRAAPSRETVLPVHLFRRAAAQSRTCTANSGEHVSAIIAIVSQSAIVIAIGNELSRFHTDSLTFVHGESVHLLCDCTSVGDVTSTAPTFVSVDAWLHRVFGVFRSLTMLDAKMVD
jgi:hypothetical protein